MNGMKAIISIDEETGKFIIRPFRAGDDESRSTFLLLQKNSMHCEVFSFIYVEKYRPFCNERGFSVMLNGNLGTITAPVVKPLFPFHIEFGCHFRIQNSAVRDEHGVFKFKVSILRSSFQWAIIGDYRDPASEITHALQLPSEIKLKNDPTAIYEVRFCGTYEECVYRTGHFNMTDLVLSVEDEARRLGMVLDQSRRERTPVAEAIDKFF